MSCKWLILWFVIFRQQLITVRWEHRRIRPTRWRSCAPLGGKSHLSLSYFVPDCSNIIFPPHPHPHPSLLWWLLDWALSGFWVVHFLCSHRHTLCVNVCALCRPLRVSEASRQWGRRHAQRRVHHGRRLQTANQLLLNWLYWPASARGHPASLRSFRTRGSQTLTHKSI